MESSTVSSQLVHLQSIIWLMAVITLDSLWFTLETYILGLHAVACNTLPSTGTQLDNSAHGNVEAYTQCYGGGIDVTANGSCSTLNKRQWNNHLVSWSRVCGCWKWGKVAQLDAHPTGDHEVAGFNLPPTPPPPPPPPPTPRVGNILSWILIMKYFLRSFSPLRWFKKGSCWNNVHNTD